ncbi:MAG: flagellar biosynthesis repressor FlbT [Alphaproteobacteria bacterium]|nr:flagellar biosynthesis repressor FlbT [Alphaproteobacteria bacterium]
MPLKIELKPRESIIIGEALITNDVERTRFYIDGNVPILREKFIMKQEEANTPCKRLYFVVLQMYLKKENKELQNIFLDYVKDLQSASPTLTPLVNEVAQAVLTTDYYGAIKHASKLMQKEEELFGDFSEL